MMGENNFDDWATPTLKEAPFYFDGITPEQYETENEYLWKNMDKLKNGTYKPLWKQKNNQ